MAVVKTLNQVRLSRKPEDMIDQTLLRACFLALLFIVLYCFSNIREGQAYITGIAVRLWLQVCLYYNKFINSISLLAAVEADDVTLNSICLCMSPGWKTSPRSPMATSTGLAKLYVAENYQPGNVHIYLIDRRLWRYWKRLRSIWRFDIYWSRWWYWSGIGCAWRSLPGWIQLWWGLPHRGYGWNM